MKDVHTLKVGTVGVAVLSCCLPSLCAATIVAPGSPVTVNQSYAYASSSQGAVGGDFVFSTSLAAAGCESGWYVKATDPGYKAIVATVLTAQAVGMQILVYGDNTDIWVGSPSGHYCRVQTVGLAS